MPQNALMMAVLFGVLLLLTVLLGYPRLPGWWRGTRTSDLPDRRQRVFVPGLVAITFLMFFGLTVALLDQNGRPRWLFYTAMVLLVAGVLLLLMLPLVAYLKLFDFLVPPWLRRGAPPRPTPGPPVVAAAKPSQSQRTRRRPKKPTMADGNGLLRVTRPANEWRDFTRKYQVEVDGSEIGRLRRGGEVSVEVKAGTHAVRGVFDSTGSPSISVAVRAGETTVVRLRPGAANDDTPLRIEVADHPELRRRPSRR